MDNISDNQLKKMYDQSVPKLLPNVKKKIIITNTLKSDANWIRKLWMKAYKKR